MTKNNLTECSYCVRLSSNSLKAILLVSVLALTGAVFIMAEDSDDTDAYSKKWGNLTWDLQDGSVFVMAGEGPMDEPVGFIDYYTWHNDYYYNCVQTVVIEEGITSIGADAFEYFPYLTTIQLPASLETIGSNAFRGTPITELTFPDGSKLVSIEKNAFKDCTSLETFKLPDSLTKIEGSAFEGCTNLIGPLDLPDSISSIGSRAFKGCSKLQGGIVSDHPIDLTFSSEAFQGCSSLTVLNIPSEFFYVAADVFNGCSSLKGSINITGSCMGVGSNAFKGCSKLAITLDFTGHSWIPPFVNESAFEGCTGLTSVNIYGGTVDEKAFAGCTGLKQVTFGDEFSKFDPSAFEGVQFFDENGDEIVVTEQTKTKLYGIVFEGSAGKLYYLEKTDEDVPDKDSGINLWMIATPVALIVGILIGAFAMKMRRP